MSVLLITSFGMACTSFGYARTARREAVSLGLVLVTGVALVSYVHGA